MVATELENGNRKSGKGNNATAAIIPVGNLNIFESGGKYGSVKAGKAVKLAKGASYISGPRIKLNTVL